MPEKSSQRAVHAISERDIREEGTVECYWCEAEVVGNVVTVIEASTGRHDTCLECREVRPWSDPS